MKLKIFLVALSIVVVCGALFFSASLRSQIPVEKTLPTDRALTLKTLATYPHDRQAFTQGLVFRDGVLYESTGQYGASTLRKVDPATGKVLAHTSLPRQYFAEGIEMVDDRIYQLTWREGFCFVYDRETLRPVEQFRYRGEGWGLAYDGQSLIMSDGSDSLYFHDPKTFKRTRTIRVTDHDAKTKKPVPIRNLNELEYIRGEIWANVWQSTRIVRIDPETGSVTGWIDCNGFVPEEYKAELAGPIRNRERVLNGIAFDPDRNRVYITGKNWPVLYEIEIVDPE